MSERLGRFTALPFAARNEPAAKKALEHNAQLVSAGHFVRRGFKTREEVFEQLARVGSHLGRNINPAHVVDIDLRTGGEQTTQIGIVHEVRNAVRVEKTEHQREFPWPIRDVDEYH